MASLNPDDESDGVKELDNLIGWLRKFRAVGEDKNTKADIKLREAVDFLLADPKQNIAAMCSVMAGMLANNDSMAAQMARSIVQFDLVRQLYERMAMENDEYKKRE